MAFEKRHGRRMFCAALLLAGMVLVCVGIAGGEYRNVLIKAVNICFECVGIG